MDARYAEARRSDHAGQTPDEGRLQGHLAVLHDQARRQAHVSRHRPAEGRAGAVAYVVACYSRREFARAALSGLALSVLPGLTRRAAAIESTVRGVRIGLITGSLNPLPENTGRDPIDVIIEQCLALGTANIELVTVFPQGLPQVINGGRFGQPPAQRSPEYTRSRQALREWRIAQPLDRFRDVRAKFDKAGLNLFSYVQTIDDDMTDGEIDAVFRQMQALKVPIFTTNQTRVGMGPRVAPFSEKYGIKAAWHPHAQVNDPNEVATPASMEKLLGMSKAFVVNLRSEERRVGKRGGA